MLLHFRPRSNDPRVHFDPCARILPCIHTFHCGPPCQEMGNLLKRARAHDGWRSHGMGPILGPYPPRSAISGIPKFSPDRRDRVSIPSLAITKSLPRSMKDTMTGG